MEPAKSPLKGRQMPRPSYKTLWTEKCADAAELSARYGKAFTELQQARHDAAYLSDRAAALEASLRRWVAAALIEALGLIIVAIILLAR